MPEEMGVRRLLGPAQTQHHWCVHGSDPAQTQHPWRVCTALLRPSTLSTDPTAPAGLHPSKSTKLLCWRSSALQGWSPAVSQVTPQAGKALWIHASFLEFAGWWTCKLSCTFILMLGRSLNLFFIHLHKCNRQCQNTWLLFSYPFWIRLNCKQFLFQSNTAS